ncbi:MAG: GTP cyclohydrolase II [Vicinamibacterales bacterium]|jgi:3,4-dihydroxy 2-butanone 4-phosphate synthase/GTP cyclohydrolase II|nr:GTP cyclohydrolase II [Acidobacteriota bacterium]MDP6372650.1 GTP cyclohydrolase II [Vicinamibacterales bacterium]MDP6610004.1 GTP cyclohydrolase II [Vicinamibacterales bacterium]HAK54932.1 GTP cyclohydrolase II [Acidobacteriota bacterium]|tara:strand:- start:4998 stop:5594 length:597 start_codon:yes stop_codon:yes gene_type:complete
MIQRAVTSRLPTRYGEFLLHAYVEEREDEEPRVHLALVRGTVEAEPAPLLRIHSECLTGDLLASVRCDCGEQLDQALAAIGEAPGGILIYLRQEGRGIGLVNKLRAYNLQDDGLDTVDANLHLGFDPDERDYSAAVDILEDLGVPAVRLLTNNPNKIAAFERSQVRVVERLPLVVSETAENANYLETKRRRLGHLPGA